MKTAQNDLWFVLRRADKNRSVFKRVGPFHTDQLRQFLRTGECSPTDFVWKRGLKQWKRISLLSEFPCAPFQTLVDTLAVESRNYKPSRAKVVYMPLSRPQELPDMDLMKKQGVRFL